MAYWDESSSDYLSAGPDSYGVSTDWGGGQDPAGNYKKYAQLNWRSRGGRSGWHNSGGRKRIRGTGTYQIRAGQEDQFREFQEANLGKEFEQGRKSYRGSFQADGLNLNRLDRSGSLTGWGSGSLGNENVYGGYGGWIGNAMANRQKVDPEFGKMMKRKDWWNRETTQGYRGQGRVAQLGSENMLRDAYEESRERLGGWGSQA